MNGARWAELASRKLAGELTKTREARRLSKNELSARTGLARSFITELEKGKTVPSVTTLGKLGHALGISPSELLKRAEKQAGPVPRFKKNR